MPNRILWVNHFAVAPDRGGGTRHFELARELRALGWDVTVAASDFDLLTRRFVRRADSADRREIREVVEGVEFAWLHAPPYVANDGRRVANWLGFARSVLRLGATDDRPSLVIGSSPHLFAAWAAARLARRLRVPFVLEVRDLWPESLQVAGRRPGPGYAALWMLARALYRRADRIVVLAEGVREYLIKRGVPEGKIVFAPNGVSMDDFGAVTGAPRESLRLVYAGAHGPANGLDAVLDAAAELRDDARVSFLLVGDGPAKEKLRERAASMSLRNVTFLDPVPKRDMPATLAACDAGLMVLKDVPLFAFGVSPNKLFDYWGAGLPVVCNVGGEVATLIAQSGGGVQATSAEGGALATAIRTLLARAPEDRVSMGARGRTWVRANRDRPLVASSLSRALGDVLTGTR